MHRFDCDPDDHLVRKEGRKEGGHQFPVLLNYTRLLLQLLKRGQTIPQHNRVYKNMRATSCTPYIKSCCAASFSLVGKDKKCINWKQELYSHSVERSHFGKRPTYFSATGTNGSFPSCLPTNGLFLLLLLFFLE
jgi:hypothetical protein